MPIINTFQSGTPVSLTGSTLANTRGTFTVDLRLYGSTTTSGPWESLLPRHIWVADAPAQVVGCMERHSVVGSTTGMLVKGANGSTLVSSVNVLSAVMDLTNAVDTAHYAAIIGSATRNQLAQGDALGWEWTNPGNAAPTGAIVVTLQYI